jgi:nucleotide-binding universal stress UspA family protein
MFTRIVLGLDGSPQSDRAFAVARDLAALTKATVTIVHVREMMLAPVVGGVPRRIDEDELEKRIRGQVADLAAAGIDTDLQIIASTYAGGPAHEIVEVARQVDAGLIVSGTRGLGLVKGLLVGSVAHRLPYLAFCPVLIVPPPHDHDGEAA